MNFFSLFLKIFGALFITIVVAIGIIIATVDPNDYRGEITELVKKETGRDLQIQSLSLSFFPRFGLNLENTTLSNAKGFTAQAFLHIDNVQLGAAILPLLSQNLEIDTLTLHGLTLNLEKNTNGITNWADLVKSDAQDKVAKKEEPTEPKNPLEALANLQFDGIDIQNGKILWQDQTTNQNIHLNIQKFSTGAITFGKFFDIALTAETTLSKPTLTTQVALNIEAKLEQTGEYEIRNLKLTTSTTGKGIPVEKVTKTLNIPTLNLALADNKLNLPSLTLDYDVIGGKDFSLKNITGQLQVDTLSGDLSTQTFQAQQLTLQSYLTGDTLPNGKVEATLSMQPHLNLTKETATLQQLALTAMGIKTTGAVKATNILSGAQVNTQLDIAKTDLRALLTQLKVTLPEMSDNTSLTQFAATFNIDFNAKEQALTINKLKLTLDDSQLTGTASVSQFDRPDIRYDLALNKIDLNRYLPTKKEPLETKKTTPAIEEAEIQLPAELLRKLTLNGTFKANQVTYDKLHPKNIIVIIKGANGKIVANPIKTDLFNTTINAQAGVDVSGNTQKFSFKLNSKNIPIGDALVATANIDKLSGTGMIDLAITTTGSKLAQFKQNLNGTTSFNLANGAIKGFNLAQTIREAQAKMSGKPVPKSKEELKTDFSSLIAQTTIKQGVITTQKLTAQAPFMRISGSGSVNLPKESLNYLIRAKIVATDKGQGGEELQSLNGLTIPVKLKGSYISPKVSLDISGLLAEKTKAELEQKKEQVINEAKQQVDKQLKETQKEVEKQLEEKLKDNLLKGFKF